MAILVSPLNWSWNPVTAMSGGFIEPECSMAFFMEGNVMTEEIMGILVAFILFLITYVILYVFG